MRQFVFCALVFIFFIVPVQVHPAGTLQVLCYHDIYDGKEPPGSPGENAVSSHQLLSHFVWLKENGYTPITVPQLLAARKAAGNLPEKAVLLTFDDGLKSFYSHVYPLLKLAGFPALAAIMVSWTDGGKNLSVPYGSRQLGAGDFLSWEQIKEIADSGLVEFASHSYDLHRGIEANPQGNLQPAATARFYNKATGKYESNKAYKKRIRKDLQKSVSLLKKHLGKGPRVMVWPYGKYTQQSAAIAARLGMIVNMTLNPSTPSILSTRSTRSNTGSDNVMLFGRHMVVPNTGTVELARMLEGRGAADPVRFVQIDLDYLYDDDIGQRVRNLDLLVERIKRLQVDIVFLQAFADPDGDGAADALYFPNRHLPMRADLFNRVAWQLKTRSGVRVFAWMPVMAFAIEGKKLSYVMEVANSEIKRAKYKRLSVFDPGVRSVIFEIYEDLAKHADFDGLLFHDDAYLGDYEDASPFALRYYREKWGLASDIESIRKAPEMFKIWSKKKTRYLISFTRQLKQRVERYRPGVKTARNIFAGPVLNKRSEEWFAQSYPLFLEEYDYTAIMAMPFMEKAGEPLKWLGELVKRAKLTDPGLGRTMFELQTKDWNTQADIPMEVLIKQMELLKSLGVTHFGYYPDDFIKGHPNLKIKKSMN
ncbi:MAG: poly-beta-1,6-N-acetyl-D-glucosamine N-deacetylase PgaB [bacterium]|nr:poly-beta-1,6-N-acetyl-D-glucosamine N-deacetylase PgaB [bacterium]